MIFLQCVKAFFPTQAEEEQNHERYGP